MKHLTAILVALLIPFQASAEGLQILPKWHMTGEEACYDFEDARLLLKYDADLYYYQQAYEPLKSSHEKLFKMMELQHENLKAVHASYNDLDIQYRDLLRQKTEGEISAENTAMLGWIVAGGVTLLAGGFITATLLNK